MATLDDLIASIRSWKRGEVRAPHKPLLLLIALARIQRGEPRLIPYRATDGGLDIETKLGALLREYGPRRKSYHPEYPFWRLQSDGLWEVPQAPALRAERGEHRNRNMPVSLLRKHGAHGGLPEHLDARLRRDPAEVNRLAGLLLDAHFPPSMHEELLDAIGMPWVMVGHRRRRRRDPGFRDAVLRVYEYRCAVCGYAGRLGQRALNLEAAHVRWHAYGGPDQLDNGVALCTFHHRAFDRGAIGLDDRRHILVSQEVHGGSHTENWLLRWSGQPLMRPQSGQPPPAAEHVAWHRSQVFRAPPRL